MKASLLCRGILLVWSDLLEHARRHQFAILSHKHVEELRQDVASQQSTVLLNKEGILERVAADTTLCITRSEGSANRMRLHKIPWTDSSRPSWSLSSIALPFRNAFAEWSGRTPRGLGEFTETSFFNCDGRVCSLRASSFTHKFHQRHAESRALRSAADVQPRLASRCDHLASQLPRRYGGWPGLPVSGLVIRERHEPQ